ncbi:MAG: hypothetical protein K2P26_00245 [Oscillospiraceae bacterium]|nr:hypothetical protein [Oscillospiraceae bacterium]
MIDALFDNKIEKKLDNIKKERARLDKKEEKLRKKEGEVAEEALNFISANTVYQVLGLADAVGKPNEQKTSRILREKFENGKLDVYDVMALSTLYKANWRQYPNLGNKSQSEGGQHE